MARRCWGSSRFAWPGMRRMRPKPWCATWRRSPQSGTHSRSRATTTSCSRWAWRAWQSSTTCWAACLPWAGRWTTCGPPWCWSGSRRTGACCPWGAEAMASIDTPRAPHAWYEDLLALLIGTLVVSFGINLLRQGGALTGGTAGLAFLAHYATGVRFGLAFFAINVPFYWLAYRHLGKAMVVKTFCAVGLVSFFAEVHTVFIHIDHIEPFYAALFGN